ncbi:DUF2690 domain-containing protein [Streptomyces sp. NPDC024062]|uniref:DUF2690 domain-containing protein n=2 Tax=unclassified Streptomyces TaxID=2593676 RepID=UPI00345344A9
MFLSLNRPAPLVKIPRGMLRGMVTSPQADVSTQHRAAARQVLAMRGRFSAGCVAAWSVARAAEPGDAFLVDHEDDQEGPDTHFSECAHDDAGGGDVAGEAESEGAVDAVPNAVDDRADTEGIGALAEPCGQNQRDGRVDDSPSHSGLGEHHLRRCPLLGIEARGQQDVR